MICEPSFQIETTSVYNESLKSQKDLLTCSESDLNQMIRDMCSEVPIRIKSFVICVPKSRSESNHLWYAFWSPDPNQVICDMRSEVPIRIKSFVICVPKSRTESNVMWMRSDRSASRLRFNWSGVPERRTFTFTSHVISMVWPISGAAKITTTVVT